MEHRALFSSVSLLVQQQESMLEENAFFFWCYIPPRGCKMEASFFFFEGLFLLPLPPVISQLKPVCLSGLHRKHNGVLQGEGGHMLSGLNQQAEGKR